MLLPSDVSLQLPVDVVDEGLSDILRACFLGLRICVGEGAQPHRPRIGSELVSLLDREFAKQRKASRSPIIDPDGDLFLRGGDVDC